jgi:hypothetical protein
MPSFSQDLTSLLHTSQSDINNVLFTTRCPVMYDLIFMCAKKKNEQ